MSLRGTSPVVAVSDVAESTRFYTETLGFEQVIGNPDHGYALFKRGEAMIAIVNAADEQALLATRTNVSAQIWVESIDALWSELKDKLEALPEGRVRAPFNQSYGTREMHVKCPDGFLMLFTEA
jgi:catechol 2,3-dioxygenase-like lactoylglutathione lyase family enzyme